MNKKTEKKIQEKIIQDRTFGLKNKNKSKTVQNFCKGVAQQVKFNGVSMNKLQQEEFERKKLEKEKEDEEKLIASLYRNVEQAMPQEEEEEELDPKQILCEYFKQGLCQKGKKCKFSHDMSLEQKTAVMDLYTDQREQMGDEWDTCNNWDEKTLKDVVEANAKNYKSQIPSDKVCDFFLEALEKNKYGWRWVCPNGMTCHYKHCLPQGYVIKRKQENRYRDQDDVEEEIDQQREKLIGTGTKITKEVFEQWKADRALKKKAEADKKSQEESKKKGGQKQANNLTGRALFVYDPTIFIDDDEAANEYEREEYHSEEEEEEDNEGKQQIGQEEEEEEEEQTQKEQLEKKQLQEQQ